MERVTAINLHRFGAGLLVEVIGAGAPANAVVRSFEFEWVNDHRTRVRPVGNIEADEAGLIADRLEAAGYAIDQALGPATYSGTEREPEGPDRQ